MQCAPIDQGGQVLKHKVRLCVQNNIQEHQSGIPLVGLWPDLCSVITKLPATETMLFGIKKREKKENVGTNMKSYKYIYT